MTVWLTRLAFVAGLGLAVALVASWQIAPARGSARLDLTVSVAPSGPLAVEPAGAVLTARRMEARTARRSASGRVTLRNITPARLLVRPRVDPADHGLDHLLRLRLSAGGRLLFDGTVGELRGGGRTFALAAGASRTVRVRAELPASAAGKYLGDRAGLALDFPARPTP